MVNSMQCFLMTFKSLRISEPVLGLMMTSTTGLPCFGLRERQKQEEIGARKGERLKKGQEREKERER